MTEKLSHTYEKYKYKNYRLLYMTYHEKRYKGNLSHNKFFSNLATFINFAIISFIFEYLLISLIITKKNSDY